MYSISKRKLIGMTKTGNVAENEVDLSHMDECDETEEHLTKTEFNDEGYIPFRDFYDKNFTDLVKLAYLFVKDVEIAQDITQDTFISVCKRYDHLSNPKAYTRVALVNKCKSYIRSRIFERQKLERLSNTAESEQNPDNDLLDVLDVLKPKQKTAVILRYYLGFSDKEIAKVINCRAASVSSLIIRSLDTIKKKVDLGIEEINK